MTQKIINLALQGGGSHGAFTWGVLDALLEDGRLTFAAISGTSAGAMNACVLAYALSRARADGEDEAGCRRAARSALKRYWNGVGMLGGLAPQTPATPSSQRFLHIMTDITTQYLSPYQSNPLGLNPLRKLVSSVVDMDYLAQQSDYDVFLSATNVRTGQAKIFTGTELSLDALMASACLPVLFHSVEIDGDAYWDGGYSANPPLMPLIAANTYPDILLIQISPIERPNTPITAEEIHDRSTDIIFNVGLMYELRSIELMQQIVKQGNIQLNGYRPTYLHRIGISDTIMETSKLRSDLGFLNKLYKEGYTSGKNWLERHFDDLGKRQTLRFPSPLSKLS